MSTITELLGLLQPHHIEAALKKLDAGESTRFSDSTKYDVAWRGKRYPPKRVAGLALEFMTGDLFGPNSFKGGEESSCFRALRRCGFTIVEKTGRVDQTLTTELAEVLSLQKEYNSTNTPGMERRGVLVRTLIPDQIRANVGKLEPIFTAAGYSLSIEGSDGIGRKVESPWVRLFDKLMSPSATYGWYVVMHFSRNGDDFFLTLGCGATVLHQGSLTPIPANDLKGQVEWAKSIATSENFHTDGFQDQIDLRGNDLSKQFERATAFAKAYRLNSFNEETFWQDAQVLCRLLVKLYEYDRLGKAPLSNQPEVLAGQAEIEEAVSPRRTGRVGQGRNVSAAERLAIEERAMVVARLKLEAEGFTDIEDVHKTKSYDFAASRSQARWMVEVKGTTSRAVECFLLTAAELALHSLNKGRTVLVLVYDIQLAKRDEGVVATGGKVELHSPWLVSHWTFEPTAYRATRTHL